MIILLLGNSCLVLSLYNDSAQSFFENIEMEMEIGHHGNHFSNSKGILLRHIQLQHRKGVKFFLGSVRSSRRYFYGLLLKSAYSLDDIAQSPIGSMVVLLTSDVDGLKFLPYLWWNAAGTKRTKTRSIHVLKFEFIALKHCFWANWHSWGSKWFLSITFCRNSFVTANSYPNRVGSIGAPQHHCFWHLGEETSAVQALMGCLVKNTRRVIIIIYDQPGA